jgi:hypothetical protein
MERKRSDDPGEINALLKVPALKNLNREKEKSPLSLSARIYPGDTLTRKNIDITSSSPRFPHPPPQSID